MVPGTERPGPASRATAEVLLLGVCFFLSGFGSLALEVVWTRQLRLVFGSTTLAASTILVAYMLGLGLGGLAGGRIAGRLGSGIRAYGWIEIAIGAYALVVPWLLAWIPEVHRALFAGLDFWPAALLRFGIALALLILPTVLMGATLPILVAALTRRNPRVARSSGLLYGVNTLGAVAGVFATTFVLFPLLGVWRTNLTGALVDVVVGVVAIAFLARLRAPVPPVAEQEPVAAARASFRSAGAAPGSDAGLLLAYAAVGFTALTCEVGWMRGLAVVVGSSVYAFAAMLGAFLTGIGAGSLLFRRFVDRVRRPRLLLGIGLATLGILSLATTLVLPLLPDLFLRLLATPEPPETRLVLLQVVLSMAIMLPPTLVLGGLFPLTTRLVAGSGRDAGEAVGRVYFANTLGSASGAFVAGFVLLPWLGLERMLAFASALSLGFATWFLARESRALPARIASLAPVAAAAAVLVLPLPFDRGRFTRGVFHHPEAHMNFGVSMLPLAGDPLPTLLYYHDGINATISVHRMAGSLALKVNGKVDASNSGDMPNQVLPAHLPLLFGPPAKKVLVIGWASGVTVGSVARHAEVERIDAVEIEPAILEAAHYFDAENGRPLEDPRVNVILDDGRTYVQSTREKYDLIISQPSNPWMAGVANLFTREFFHAVRGALAPGGRLMQWMQLYGMDAESVAAVLAALRSEFPYVYGFSPEGDGPNLLLLAGDRPLGRDDLPRWKDLDPAVQADLRRVGNFTTADLWSLLRVLPSDVDAIAERARTVNSDENLLIELRAPLMSNRVDMAQNWRAMAPSPVGIVPLLDELGVTLDEEGLGALAFSYGARRRAYEVAERLLELAGEQGRAGRSISAAVAMVRDASDSVSLENQLASLDEAVALAPDAFEPVLLRGRVRLEAGEGGLALDDADRALSLRPAAPRARRLRMRALAALGRYDEAIEEAEVLRARPFVRRDEALRKEIAVLYAEAGRDETAIQLLETLLREHDASWEEGWALLAVSHERRGEARRAKAARYNIGVARRNHGRSLHRMARAALWYDKPSDARVLLSLAVAADPEYAPARDDLEDLGGIGVAR